MFVAEYASAEAIAHEALALLLPPERLTVPEHASRYRWLNNAGGGHVGLFPNEEAPYTVQPSECLTSLDYLTTCVVGPGQVAKTVIAENWFLHMVDTDPANLVWYMQTDDGLESYVKGRINPMIDLHEERLKARLGKRAVDDSLHFKNFGAMTVEFLAASPRTLINKSIPRLVADEIDNWQILGDVKSLLDIRRQTYGRQSMLLALSHADRARGMDPEKDWTAGIAAIYADSDRRIWWWRCPECGATSSPHPSASRYMALDYPDDPDVPLDVIEREAVLICPVNGCVVHDHQRKAMNLDAYQRFGGWLGKGQEISEGGEVSGELVAYDTAGFWIVGTMSPFVLGGIGGLARARVKAERELEIDGDDDSLRQVIVKQWGWGYSRPRAKGSVEAKDLVDRAVTELQRGVVPTWVRFLVVAVDIQQAHFEFMVRGFGPGGESVIIDTGKITADPATNPDDWDALLTDLFLRTYPLGDGSGRFMAIRAAGYDSGGQPGVTQQAYSAWRRWRRDRKVRLYGKIGGREAWAILPLKGANTPNASRLTVTYPDTGRQAGKVASSGDVPVGLFNPNRYKEDLNGQLQRAEPGPWYVHLAAWLKSKGEVHPFFEQLVAERQLPNGKWEKVASHARNEALDLMVMTHVMADLHGVTRINWEAPPAWAAPWDVNTGIVAGGGPTEADSPPRTPFASNSAKKASKLA